MVKSVYCLLLTGTHHQPSILFVTLFAIMLLYLNIILGRDEQDLVNPIEIHVNHLKVIIAPSEFL